MKEALKRPMFEPLERQRHFPLAFLRGWAFENQVLLYVFSRPTFDVLINTKSQNQIQEETNLKKNKKRITG